MAGRHDEDYARAILPHIPRAGTGVTRPGPEIARAVGGGFSIYKVQKGVAHMRDTYVVAQDCLITDRHGWYGFTLDLAAIEEYRTRRGRQAQRILDRTYTGAVERVFRQQQAQHPRRIARSKKAYEQLLQDLARLHQAPLF